MPPPRKRNLVPHKLPPDILYLIAEFASFEERAKLVRCNKWLYRICHPLLFRDIYLHTPKQLVNLWGNTKAMHMLGKTESILISEVTFMPHTWERIQVSLHPADYLIQVLEASASLLRLQIIPDATTDPGSYWHSRNFEFRDDFERQLRSQASNSEFLPKLSVIVDRSRYINLKEFQISRPIVLYASFYSHCVFVRASTCPGSPEQPPARNPSTSSTLSQPARPTYQNFSATDFGRFIYESMAGPYPSIATTLGILGTRIDESSNTQPTHEDTLSWLSTMVSAAKLTHIESLFANIEPMCPSQPLAAQHAVIERLRRLLPHLTSAKILRDSVEWRRSRSTTESDKAQPSNLPLPIWTPRPDLRYPGVLEWWVAALGLDISGAHDHELRDKVRLLHNAMSTRWENRWIPSEEEMYEHLFASEE